MPYEDTVAPNPEKSGNSTAGRFAEGVGNFLESQAPQAHTERIMGLYDALADKAGGTTQQKMESMRSPMETAAKVAGVGVTVGEIGLVALAAKKVGGMLFGEKKNAVTAEQVPSGWKKIATSVGGFGMKFVMGMGAVGMLAQVFEGMIPKEDKSQQ